MISIGITGTKGKSTTTYMIRDIIEKSGKPAELLVQLVWQLPAR